MQAQEQIYAGVVDEAEENDVDLAIVEERNQEIRQIEQDTSIIAEIMGHLSFLVSEQGETLDDAAENLGKPDPKQNVVSEGN